ncbi:MAG TPA: response regulator [Candidatus Binatia bacterium]|jgi:CheY-like chemotaxis protein|nr:response regulator [Candidatus Binatia bacterium]
MPVALHLQAVKPQKGPRLKKEKEKEKDAFLPEAGPAPSGKEPPLLIGRNRRILVVDDNPVILKAFEQKLKATGFSVTTLSDAAATASTAEQDKAELIILDINFNASNGVEWSGFTIMQWLRRFPELAGIPVILVTGGDPSIYKERALAAGAVAFFQKPVDPKALLSAIFLALEK